MADFKNLITRVDQAEQKDEALVVEVRRFLLDNLYNQHHKTNTKKSNALNKLKTTYSDLNTRDDEAYYVEQEKYLRLIKFYISQTSDYMLAKNMIYTYLLDEQSIKIKTLGLQLLNIYLQSSTNNIFKCDKEFYENIVPIIEQFFFYIPPHFALNISFPLIKELFDVFNFSIDNETNKEKKQDLVLIVYSENVISTMIPALLLAKTENIPLLNYILKQLHEKYINEKVQYFVNIRRVLHSIKPLKMYPEYIKSLDNETLRCIFLIIKLLPLYDETDAFYKYDLIACYLLFDRYADEATISELDKAEFLNNLKNKYTNVDNDIEKIMYL